MSVLEDEAVGKAGYSSMCRRGSHTLCDTAVTACACPHHKGSRAATVAFLAGNGNPAARREATRTEPTRAKDGRRKWSDEDKARIVAEAEAEGTTTVAKRYNLSPSLLKGWRVAVDDSIASVRAAGRAPVFELVKANPPEPPRKKTIAEQVRPLLEEILVAGDHDWYRVILFQRSNQANFNIKKVRDCYSTTEWEWRAVKLMEVDQSAVYVRWKGTEGRLA